MYISVFNKNRPYLHVSLRGIFKPDPKDFFLQKVPYSIILRQNWVLGRLPKKGPVYLLNESKQVSSKNLPEILCFFWELVFKLMKPKDTYLHNELCQLLRVCHFHVSSGCCLFQHSILQFFPQFGFSDVM